mmetsp:Transcript_9328/g.19073  ORF Transcript_9328/g.19073 Transcript_9328/m.19073 type:complete len:104 (-) Transcript_9328:977-1288(-)
MKELAFDTSSDAVRQAVAEGITLILKNPLTHDIMSKLLPVLAPMLRDKSDRVRISFSRLLDSINGSYVTPSLDAAGLELWAPNSNFNLELNSLCLRGSWYPIL